MKQIKVVLIIAIIGLAVNSCMTDYYMYKQRRFYKKAIVHQPFDAIIVPGYPYKGRGSVSIIKMRMLWAVHLYKKGIAKNIIFSGSAVYTPYVESKIMRLMAIQLGVDSTHIFTEEKAEHSTENIYYSLKIAKIHGWKNIALATDNIQISIVNHFVKKHKLDVKYLAASITVIDSLDKITPKIVIKDTLAFVNDFVPITETQSFRYRWRGTRGKNINFDDNE